MSRRTLRSAKREPNALDTPPSMANAPPSSSSRPKPRSRRKLIDQSTLTQMQFGTPLGGVYGIIEDSENDMPTEEYRPRKRRRTREEPVASLKKQTTLTQMDFLSLMEGEDIEELLARDMSHFSAAPDSHFRDQTVMTRNGDAVIPNSSQAVPRRSQELGDYMQPIPEEIICLPVSPPRPTTPKRPKHTSPKLTTPKRASPEPTTPKRIRQNPVPSSQTPAATPISIHRTTSRPGSSSKQKATVRFQSPSSPTPKARRSEIRQSSSPPPERPSDSIGTQVTQSQTSTATKIRIRDFNSRWKQLSGREMHTKPQTSARVDRAALGKAVRFQDTPDNLYISEPSSSVDDDARDLAPTSARQTATLEVLANYDVHDEGDPSPQLPEIPRFSVDTLAQESYLIGDETQAAFLEAATSSEIGLMLEQEQTSESPVQSNMQICVKETPFNDIPPAIMSSQRGNQESAETHQLRSPSPIAHSQASTASCTPDPEDQNEGQKEQTIQSLLRHNQEIDTLPSRMHESPPSTSIEYLRHVDPVTISQLLPSSLIGSDIPLPPKWSQHEDDAEL